jgi:hypothetical protein
MRVGRAWSARGKSQRFLADMTVAIEHWMIVTRGHGLRKIVRDTRIGTALGSSLARPKYEQVVTVTRLVRETNLAWALAQAVKPHLSAIKRNHVFMAIGAGETFTAIRGLLKSVAVKRIALRPDLVQQCITWLHAYVGTRTSSTFAASLKTSSF